ncbi:MAG: hypothetical protein JRI97_00335 [Deltaproteobacteria bacterium]|nr:hypothetical protein [Deltaproteobacteria bacterium]
MKGRLATFFWLDLALLSLLILASRAATAAHEVLGHAAFALAAGGRVEAIRISLLGGGRVEAAGPEEGSLAHLAYAFSGIAVNLALGLAAAWGAGKCLEARKGNLAAFLALFAMAGVCGGLAYLVLGAYYRFGDPAAWADSGLAAPWLVWAVGLGALFPAAWWVSRPWMRYQQAVAPASRLRGKTAVAAASLGVACAAYAGLYLALDQSLVPARAPRAAYERAVQKAAEQKRARLARALREEHPQWSEEKLRHELENISIHVSGDEVDMPPPLTPVVALLLAAGFLAAEAFSPKESPPGPPPPGKWEALSFSALAALVLSLLAAVGSVVYRG